MNINFIFEELKSLDHIDFKTVDWLGAISSDTRKDRYNEIAKILRNSIKFMNEQHKNMRDRYDAFHPCDKAEIDLIMNDVKKFVEYLTDQLNHFELLGG